jgi:hypothetical protein
VRAIREHDQVSYDLMIVATLERSGQQVANLVTDGVPVSKLFPLRQEGPQRRVGVEPPKTGTTPNG